MPGNPSHDFAVSQEVFYVPHLEIAVCLLSGM